MSGALGDLLGSRGFLTGLGTGIVALAAALALGGVWRARRRGPAPVAGLLVAAAAVVALAADDRLDGAVVSGAALLAAAGVVAWRWPWVGPLAALPGSALLLADVRDGTVLGGTLGPVLVAVAAALVAETDRRHATSGLGPLFLAAAAAGVYLCVPDTEHAQILVGAAIPVAAAAWPVPLTALGRPGAYASVGVLAWVVAVDGHARPGSVVGGLAALGLLLIEPVARLARGGRTALDRHWPRHPAVVAAGLFQLVVVLWCARVAGFEQATGPAVALAGVAFAAAAAMLAVAAPSRP